MNGTPADLWHPAPHPQSPFLTSLPSYTSKFFKSADEHNQHQLDRIAQRLHLAQPEELSVEKEEDLIEEDFLWKRQRQGYTSLEEENSLSERQEEKNKRVTETAFLVTRTNQQSLALVMVGIILTGVLYHGLVMTNKPSYCSSRDMVFPTISLSYASFSLPEPAQDLVCAGLSNPLSAAILIVWPPLLFHSVVAGLRVSSVALESTARAANHD